MNKYGEHDFLAACREGNLEAVNVFLNQGDFDIDKQFTNRRTHIPVHGLFMAVIKGHAEVVQRLVNAGANLHQTCRGYTLLYGATYNGHIDVIKVLLNTKAVDVDQVLDNVDRGATALTQAVWDGHAEIVKLLLETGANPSREWHFDGSFNKTLLTMAKIQWFYHLLGPRDKRLEYTQIIDYLTQANQVHKEQHQTSQRTRNTRPIEITTVPSQEGIEMSIFNVQSGSKK
ncbi:ankyrin repeat domain-containing protein [Sansalvadorimonas verongulae]|nr:ankyrin repeat domain-containing protein [Sansalvadorimonas verongulae]